MCFSGSTHGKPFPPKLFKENIHYILDSAHGNRSCHWSMSLAHDQVPIFSITLVDGWSNGPSHPCSSATRKHSCMFLGHTHMAARPHACAQISWSHLHAHPVTIGFFVHVFLANFPVASFLGVLSHAARLP